MNLEQQVCSLDLAKRLSDLGIHRQSTFYWRQMQSDEDFQIQFGDPRTDSWRLYSAFTVAELGEMLPAFFKHPDEGYIDMVCRQTQRLANRFWYADYVNRDGTVLREEGDTEADARTKMLIYLIENKLISL